MPDAQPQEVIDCIEDLATSLRNMSIECVDDLIKDLASISIGPIFKCTCEIDQYGDPMDGVSIKCYKCIEASFHEDIMDTEEDMAEVDTVRKRSLRATCYRVRKNRKCKNDVRSIPHRYRKR